MIGFERPTTTSEPLVTDFLKLRPLRWGSSRVAAMKKTGHNKRSKSARARGGEGVGKHPARCRFHGKVGDIQQVFHRQRRDWVNNMATVSGSSIYCTSHSMYYVL